jgi:hypothetical protein
MEVSGELLISLFEPYREERYCGDDYVYVRPELQYRVRMVGEDAIRIESDVSERYSGPSVVYRVGIGPSYQVVRVENSVMQVDSKGQRRPLQRPLKGTYKAALFDCYLHTEPCATLQQAITAEGYMRICATITRHGFANVYDYLSSMLRREELRRVYLTMLKAPGLQLMLPELRYRTMAATERQLPGPPLRGTPWQ